MDIFEFFTRVAIVVGLVAWCFLLGITFARLCMPRLHHRERSEFRSYVEQLKQEEPDQ